MRRIIIAGSRNYSNYDVIRSAMSTFDLLEKYKPENIEIVSGGCRGVDTLAEKFAKEFGYKFTEFPADWSLGKRAGYLRNKQMAEYAAKENGMLVAFWDMKSRGTKLMIELAKKYKLQIYVINTENLEVYELRCE